MSNHSLTDIWHEEVVCALFLIQYATVFTLASILTFPNQLGRHAITKYANLRLRQEPKIRATHGAKTKHPNQTKFTMSSEFYNSKN